MSIFMGPMSSPNILVVEHSDLAPGGNFSRGLEKRGCTLNVLRPLNGDELPQETTGYAGLVVLGGPQNALDDNIAPHFPQLTRLMRLFDNEGKPTIGICLGCQLLARAWGQLPKPLGFLEIGFLLHKLTGEAADDPLLGQGALPPLMEFHEDTFDLPQDSTLLVEGEGCRNQCFKVGNCSYGFQFHLEVESSTVKEWLEKFLYGTDEHYGKYRDEANHEEIRSFAERIDSYISDSERFCDQITERWLALAMSR